MTIFTSVKREAVGEGVFPVVVADVIEKSFINRSFNWNPGL
jgi:hypothetical protein